MVTPSNVTRRKPARLRTLTNVKIVIDKSLKDKLRHVAYVRDESYTEILVRAIEREFAAVKQGRGGHKASPVVPEVSDEQ